MKKIIFSFVVASIVVSCGNGSSSDKPTPSTPEKKETPATADNDLSNNPDYKKGLALIKPPADCFTCHKVDEPLTGPTYRDVANKYAGLPDTIVAHLASKIIKGGNGVWGETYMTPHPGVSEEDAKAMVKYILLLKK